MNNIKCLETKRAYMRETNYQLIEVYKRPKYGIENWNTYIYLYAYLVLRLVTLI